MEELSTFFPVQTELSLFTISVFFLVLVLLARICRILVADLNRHFLPFPSSIHPICSFTGSRSFFADFQLSPPAFATLKPLFAFLGFVAIPNPLCSDIFLLKKALIKHTLKKK